MRHDGYAMLALILLLASRPASAADPTDPDGFKFENKVRQFARLEPVECGRVRPHHDAYPAAICANDQLLMKHTFVMSYYYEWRNVSFYVGFAADSAGNLYQLEFERHHDYFFYSAGLGLQNDVGEPYVEVRRCPRPTHIYVRPSANREFFGFTCEQPESPGLPPNATRERLE